MCRLRTWLALAVLAAGCARQEAPPGGAPRSLPPVLLSTYPADSECVVAMRGSADFELDEVISYGAQPNFGLGTGDLERLILLSPDTAVPSVQWHRNRVTVKPRGGWRPNTVYRIELLPGLRDVRPRPNEMKTGGVIAFTTGGTCPARSLSGRTIDWAARRGVPYALVEAMHLPDSARYRTVADSTGRFRFKRLPDGTYLVAGIIDQNRDHRRQVSESWDTVRVGASEDTVGEIWAFTRDTLPPKIQSISQRDSFSIIVNFTRPIDPTMRLDSTALRVMLILPSGDSGTIAPLEAMPRALYDSLHPVVVKHTPAQDSAARRDSVTKDSIRRATAARPPSRAAPVKPSEDLPLQRRPELGSALVIRTRGRVDPGKKYVVQLRGVRMAGGVTGDTPIYPFETAKPPSAADSAKARADSAKARADSAKAHGDTTKARPDTVKSSAKPDSLPAKRIKPDSGGGRPRR